MYSSWCCGRASLWVNSVDLFHILCSMMAHVIDRGESIYTMETDQRQALHTRVVHCLFLLLLLLLLKESQLLNIYQHTIAASLPPWSSNQDFLPLRFHSFCPVTSRKLRGHSAPPPTPKKAHSVGSSFPHSASTYWTPTVGTHSLPSLQKGCQHPAICHPSYQKKHFHGCDKWGKEINKKSQRWQRKDHTHHFHIIPYSW